MAYKYITQSIGLENKYALGVSNVSIITKQKAFVLEKGSGEGSP